MLLLLAVLLAAFAARAMLRSGWWARRSHDIAAARQVRTGAAAVRQAESRPLQRVPVADLRRAADVYAAGVPDRYTSSGDVVRGIAPDAAAAVRAFRELLGRGQADAALPLAQLLERGTPNDTSVVDRSAARDMYLQHFNSLRDPHQKYEALEALERVSHHSDRYHIEDMRQRIAQELADVRAAQQVRRQTHRRADRRADLELPAETLLQLRDAEGLWRLPLDAWRQTVAAEPVPAEGVQIRNDAQNVHDSTVIRTVRASVDRLQAAGATASPQRLHEVRRHVQQADVSEDRRRSALQALDHIERTDATLDSIPGVSEGQLLGLVWDRIAHPDNAENRGALQHNLVTELSESVEQGVPVCATGRFTRVLGTLDGVDSQVEIKPKWALQKEMVDRAGALYAERVAALPEEHRAAVQAVEPTPEQAATGETVMQSVKNDIRQDFHDSYVKPGIMSQTDLDVEVSQWIDSIG